MQMSSWGSRIAAAALVVLAGSTAVASVAPWLPLPAVDDRAGHRSSLRARATMLNGAVRTMTIQGVGCTERLCSRVRAKDTTADTVWLDGLASIRAISHETEGPVRALFTLRNGVERQASIIPANRVLYVQGRFGRTEKLDLASLTRIDFDPHSNEK